MDPLAGSDYPFGRRIIHVQNIINKHTCGIYYDTGIYCMIITCFFISCFDAAYQLLFIFNQIAYFHIIQNNTTVFHGSLRQVNCQTGVIKLAIVIDNPSI